MTELHNLPIEKRVLAAVLKSRPSWAVIKDHLSAKSLTKYGEYFLGLANDFYQRDSAVASFDTAIAESRIVLDIPNPKNREMYRNYMTEVMAIDISAINMAQLVLDIERKERGMELALDITNGRSTEKIIQKLEEYRAVMSRDALEETSEKPVALRSLKVAEVFERAWNPKGLVKLGTKALTAALGGGALPGHHILIFGRPNVSKTATCITLGEGFVRQKKRTAHFMNEDPEIILYGRYMTALTRMSREEIIADQAKADSLFETSGSDYLHVVPLTPGDPSEIEKYIVDNDIECCITEQLRNLTSKSEGKVLQLDELTQEMRNIGKRRGVIMIESTQAGDSAHNKLLLEMNDVDFSKTGVPGGVDLMLGIGCNPEYYALGLRMFNFPKNKINANHGNLVMRFNEKLSRMEDVS